MAAYTPTALSRVARESNGWFPVGVPLSAVGQMFDGIKEMAKSSGRDPKNLELLIRGNVEFTTATPSGQRADFTGTSEQIAGDIAAAKKLGANELVLDVQFSPDIKTGGDVLRRMEELYKLAG